MANKQVVDALSMTADHTTCPCGEVIALADTNPPVAPSRQICPKCGAKVRWTVLEGFHIPAELI